MTKGRRSSIIWTPGDPVEKTDFSFVSWVTPEIAICSYDVASNEEVLDIEGIRTLISIGGMSPSCASSSIKHVEFPLIEDATMDISEHDAKRVVMAMGEGSANGKTLVHCAAGVSRSPGFVTLFLAVSKNISWDESKEIVLRGRPQMKMHPLTESRLRQILEKWRSV